MGYAYLLERLKCDSLTLGGMLNVSLAENFEEALLSGSSALDPYHFAVGRFAPLLTGQTLDVKALWDAATASSRIIPHIPIDESNPLIIYLAQAADSGTRSGGTANLAVTIRKGVLIPGPIGANGMMAVASFTVYADANSEDNAVTVETGATLPSGGGGPAARWRLFGLINNADASNAIRRVVQMALDPGIGVSRAMVGSALEPQDSSVDTFRPTLTFASEAIKHVLDWTGPTGAAAAGNGFRMVLAPYTSGGVGFASTGTIAFSLRAGSMILPQTITLEGGAGRTIECLGVGVGAAAYDVNSRPLDYATGLDASAFIDDPATTESERFMSGPCYDNTTLLTEITGGSVNFGIDYELAAAAAFPWPIKCWVRQRAPQFRLTGINGDFYQELVATPGRAINTSFRVFLRRMTADGHGVSDATTNHVKLSMAGGLIMPDGLAGGHLEAQRHSVRVVKADNAALTIATGSAIS